MGSRLSSFLAFETKTAEPEPRRSVEKPRDKEATRPSRSSRKPPV